MKHENTTDVPEKQVSIDTPFCFNQHSDNKMLQSLLKIKTKDLISSQTILV